MKGEVDPPGVWLAWGLLSGALCLSGPTCSPHRLTSLGLCSLLTLQGKGPQPGTSGGLLVTGRKSDGKVNVGKPRTPLACPGDTHLVPELATLSWPP